MKQPVARDLDEEQANSGHGQLGHETAGELPNIYIYIVTVASRMAVAPRGHRHRWRANNPFFVFQSKRNGGRAKRAQTSRAS